MEEFNPLLRRTVLDVVENQIRRNDPPETKETFDRLVNEGYSESDAKQLIGSVVAAEIFGVLKHGRRFDEEKFVSALR